MIINEYATKCILKYFTKCVDTCSYEKVLSFFKNLYRLNILGIISKKCFKKYKYKIRSIRFI